MDAIRSTIESWHNLFASDMLALPGDWRLYVFIAMSLAIVASLLLIIAGMGKKHKSLANGSFISGILLSILTGFAYVVAWL